MANKLHASVSSSTRMQLTTQQRVALVLLRAMLFGLSGFLAWQSLRLAAAGATAGTAAGVRVEL
jgi:DNA-binding response OmpR family regulator